MRQCFQLADSSAAKLQRGRIKMQVAGQICGRNLAGFSLKGPKRGRVLKISSFLYFFDMIVMKTCNFHRFLYKFGFKIYCYKMVIKLLFYKREEFFYSAAENFGHSGRKMLKELATLV
jgi:hypothetical protein